ncbi:atp-dependent dna helicase pif1, partial [Nannochloropsis oceanica]
MKTNLAVALVVRVGPPTLPAGPADDLHLSSTDSKPTAKPNSTDSKPTAEPSSTVNPHIEKAFAKNMPHTLPNKSALLLKPNKLVHHKKTPPSPMHTSTPTPYGAASRARAWTSATVRASPCLSYL